MKLVVVVLAPLTATGLGQTTWYVDGVNCTGAGDGSSTNPFCTIQEGVDAAQDGDRIEVRAGEYVEVVSVDGKRLTVHARDGFEQTILRSAPEGTDPDFPAMSVSSGADLALSFLTIKGSRPGVTVDLSKVYLKDCHFEENQDSDSFSGAQGILADQSQVNLQQCSFIISGDFTDAYSISGSDSAIHAYGSSLTVPLDALGYTGGAVYLEGYELELVDTRVHGSYTFDAPVFVSDSRVRIKDCEFFDSGTNDGAAAVQFNRCSFDVEASNFHDTYNFQGQGTLKAISSQGTLLNCVFKDNRHFQSWAGGVFIVGRTSDVAITNCFFEGNEGDDGGGISSWAGKLTVEDSTFKNNWAVGGSSFGFGGALYLESPVKAVVTNCLFEGNTAVYYYETEPNPEGGAVWGAATIRSCTFVNNRTLGSTGDGGGACSGGAVLEDCIVWGNTPNQLEDVGAVTYSDVQGGWFGQGNIDEDPVFWGPVHGDYHLLPGSPCIDAGDPTRQDADGTRIDMGVYPFDDSYCGSPGTYCTPKVNSRVCFPAIGSTGTPTLEGADDFHVTAEKVLPHQPGILIWSRVGPAYVPFLRAFRCVATPFLRTRVVIASDLGIGPCPGYFDLHFSQAYMDRFSLQHGERLYMQFWYRDPDQGDGTGAGLTDGLEATICAGP